MNTSPDSNSTYVNPTADKLVERGATTTVVLQISTEASDELTAAANRFGTSRPHIADVVFRNLHKLEIIDPNGNPTTPQ